MSWTQNCTTLFHNLTNYPNVPMSGSVEICLRRGYSVSGGARRPDERLYVTGHDAAALYVRDFPEMGPELNWIATVPVPAEGQAFGWNPTIRAEICLILKRTSEVIVGRVTLPAASL